MKECSVSGCCSECTHKFSLDMDRRSKIKRTYICINDDDCSHLNIHLVNANILTYSTVLVEVLIGARFIAQTQSFQVMRASQSSFPVSFQTLWNFCLLRSLE